MRAVDRREVARFVVVASVSLGVATLGVAILQDVLNVPNPSSLYLVAVVTTAIASGTWGGVIASILSFALYNFLFVEPRYTLSVAQPGEFLNLLLLLFVGIVVGQLAALQRRRADEAVAREREARSLFHVSRALATRASTPEAIPEVVSILRADTRMGGIWIGLGPEPRAEKVAPTRAWGRARRGLSSRCSSGCPGTPPPAGVAFTSRPPQASANRRTRRLSRPHRGRWRAVRLDLGAAAAGRSPPIAPRRDCSPRRRTSWARRSARIDSRPRPGRPRSRGRAKS